MIRTVSSFVFGLLLVTGGCGARTDIESEAANSCGPSGAPLSPTVARVRDRGCVLEARDSAGRLWAMECALEKCRMFVDGELRCSCSDMDYVNTCPTGEPTCRGWQYFSYLDVSYIDERED